MFKLSQLATILNICQQSDKHPVNSLIYHIRNVITMVCIACRLGSSMVSKKIPICLPKIVAVSGVSQRLKIQSLSLKNLVPSTDLGPTTPVHELVPDIITEKIMPCPEGVLCTPQHPHEHIEWGSGSGELRVLIDQKVVQVVENAFCTCAAFADTNSLVTGSSDYTVRLWKASRGPHPNSSTSGLRITLSHIMRVHTDEVVSVASSRAWSLVVSGSRDGSAALWDLNKGVYVRSIWHGEGGESSAVSLVSINESTVSTSSSVEAST